MRLHRFIRPLVLVSLLLALSAASFAGVFVSVSVGPPPIPVYAQPICPGAGYMWTPGYWAWGDDGYFWVPGTWVMAPTPGYLWTPGYWGWSGGVYLWHGGYWGPHVGFYGGINYGFGYGGVGFLGGEWRGNNFYYNRSVSNVNVTNVTNVYNKTVIVNNNSHVAFNGGTGGVRATPTAQEKQWENEKHMEPTAAQTQHHEQAGKNPQFLAKNNGGKPAVAATSKPGEFSGKGVVGAKAAGGPVNHAALTANSKNMPKANTSAAAGAGAKGSTGNTAKGGNNVPKPSGASTSTHTNASTTAGSHNVPKPPNASSSTNTHTSAAGGGSNLHAGGSANTTHGGGGAGGGAATHTNAAGGGAVHQPPQPHNPPAQHQQSAPAKNPPPPHEKPHR